MGNVGITRFDRVIELINYMNVEFTKRFNYEEAVRRFEEVKNAGRN